MKNPNLIPTVCLAVASGNAMAHVSQAQQGEIVWHINGAGEFDLPV
ncbi:MAG: hypothetical protein R6X16_04770 [Anaerolineae bacterium]